MEIERLKTEILHKEELISEKDNAISRLEERSHMMENEISAVRGNWKIITYGAVGIAMMFGMFLMIYVFLDMRNPNLGLIQDGHTSPIVYVAAILIVGAFLSIGHAIRLQRMEEKKNADNTR